MSFQFSQVPLADIPRSVFNRTHQHKTTFDAGYLIPVYVDEALPGDTFQLDASFLCRAATLLRPLMDNLYLDCFFFSVPNRLVWSNWQKCMGEQLNPGDSISFIAPIVTVPGGGFAAGSLFDYFGLPVGINDGSGWLAPTAFHSRAYNLIWNEWFRDENLQTRATVDVGDGPDTASNYVLRRRGKRHDYFTSCLPWPQKGTQVTLPLGTSAPVKPLFCGTGMYAGPAFATREDGSGLLVFESNVDRTLTRTGGNPSALTALVWADKYHDGSNYQTGGGVGLYADLTTATAATINQLRQAFQIQRLMERDARGGTRYVELLRSHFGVVSPDARVQRPEYLGGGSVRLSVNPVVQTSAAAAQPTPQGNLAAFAVGSGSGIGFSKSFTEHCVILGLVSVRADLTYQQGKHRMWSRRGRYDWYWPSLAHLGEQAVNLMELYAQGTADDIVAFGYQERWAEYRYAQSKITGKFRSTDATPLDSWHLAQEFLSAPSLNATFIEDAPPMDRVLAVPSEPDFLFDSDFQVKCTRPMPTYSVPGMIDHF